MENKLYLFLKAIEAGDSSLIDDFEEETINIIKDAFYGFFYTAEIQKDASEKYYFRREQLLIEGKKYIDYIERLNEQ